jgi:hypothetical protein
VNASALAAAHFVPDKGNRLAFDKINSRALNHLSTVAGRVSLSNNRSSHLHLSLL